MDEGATGPLVRVAKGAKLTPALVCSCTEVNVMRAILIDDEALAIERLATGLAAIPEVTVVATATGAAEGLSLIEQLCPDLVFLDIDMPGMSGIALAKQLMEQATSPEIVFVTAFDQYAAQAFDIEAADYLLKPVGAERLRMGVARALRRRRTRVTDDGASVHAASPLTPIGSYDNALWVPVKQGSVLLPVETINLIEAAKDYVLLHTDLKAHILRAKMSELEQRLDPKVLLRVHRSYMVRLATVTAVERPGRGMLRLRLADDSSVQVGPLYMDEVAEALKLTAH